VEDVKARNQGALPAVPEAAQGVELHKLVEEILVGSLDVSKLEGEQAFAVRRCVEFVERQGYEGGQAEEMYEIREAGELVARCRADFVQLLEGAAMVVDWKFYHQPLDHDEAEWQMLVTVCAVAMHHGVNQGYAKLYLPLLDQTYEYEVRDVLEAYQTRILPAWERMNDSEDDMLRTGRHCARCPALGHCSAASHTMGQLVLEANLGAIWSTREMPAVRVMTESMYDAMREWSPARIRGVLEWLPVVPAFEAAVKQVVRDGLAEDPGLYPGWVLKDKNLPAECTDVAGLHKSVVEDGPLTDEEFAACSKLSVAQVRTKLTDALVDAGLADTKKAAGVLAEQFVGPYVTRATTRELRRVKL
jgi:CRISPR/Cas system-associated exonuclease Cas4 (RecB family)